ncbi:MAG: hypothetical protein LBB55_05655 [Zoogloeaceae bacterium]|jgi:hypothetical protein|nr:hypothetical protein [Zoogloeaceae bacterium]
MFKRFNYLAFKQSTVLTVDDLRNLACRAGLCNIICMLRPNLCDIAQGVVQDVIHLLGKRLGGGLRNMRGGLGSSGRSADGGSDAHSQHRFLGDGDIEAVDLVEPSRDVVIQGDSSTFANGVAVFDETIGDALRQTFIDFQILTND